MHFDRLFCFMDFIFHGSHPVQVQYLIMSRQPLQLGCSYVSAPAEENLYVSAEVVKSYLKGS